MRDEQFYLANEKHTDINGKTVAIEKVLYFKMTLPNLVPEIKPEIYDGRATRQQVEYYKPAYDKFAAANSTYKLPWAEEAMPEQPAGAPTSEPVVESVVEPVVAKKSERVIDKSDLL